MTALGPCRRGRDRAADAEPWVRAVIATPAQIEGFLSAPAHPQRTALRTSRLSPAMATVAKSAFARLRPQAVAPSGAACRLERFPDGRAHKRRVLRRRNHQRNLGYTGGGAITPTCESPYPRKRTHLRFHSWYATTDSSSLGLRTTTRRVPDRLATCSKASPPNPDQECFERALSMLTRARPSRALRASAEASGGGGRASH
jgi:hypothetical protein